MQKTTINPLSSMIPHPGQGERPAGRRRWRIGLAAIAVAAIAWCIPAAHCRGAEGAADVPVIVPRIETAKGPLRPQVWPDTDQSVIFEHSPHMINKEARPNHPYEPIEDGGFRITGSPRSFNRHINQAHNALVTGDTPRFRVSTSTGSGCYMSDNRTFPLFARPDASKGGVTPSLGELRLAIRKADGQPLWLDTLPGTTASFYPGYTEYQLREPAGTWQATITVAPALDFHGFICRIEFSRDMPLQWQYANLWYTNGEPRANRVELKGRHAILTDASLPNGQVVVGWNGNGEVRSAAGGAGELAEAWPATPQKTYCIMQTWGVSTCDLAKAKEAMARLDNPNTKAWTKPVKSLQDDWFDWMITRALNPEKHYQALAGNPEGELRKTLDHWIARRQEFQIRTPDHHLTALINWNRCLSEYHHQGPGLLLGTELWAMYSHISVGWYGKEWGGDHKAIEDNLRYYAACQRDDGYIRWISEAMVPYDAEDNTTYWVDQVWQHYRWTGDRTFLADMWPHVQRAMKFIPKGDPDGDGLYRAFYEYWNADSNGKGPKAAAPTATAWMAFRAAANLAAAMHDEVKAAEYQAMAKKIRDAAMTQLWNEKAGRLGSIGSDGLWRGHGAIWEQYLAINAGMLDASQSRSAMRWLDSHLGFEPNPDVRLLMCSDFWPLRWSVQWVVSGDTCLAIQAGLRHGDAAIWWPYLKTLARAPFQDDGGGPGIRMAVNNHGCAGGEREDVDSDDPHTQVTVRGLFGIEPDIPAGRVEILPGFPAEWTSASIRTPDLDYTYQREGDVATFKVTSSRPLVKRIRANFGGEEITTPAETTSIVKLHLAPAGTRPAGNSQSIIRTGKMPLVPYAPLSADERQRQVLVDLGGACNQTLEQLTTKTAFTFDHQDGPSPLSGWWSNPKLKMPPSPAMLKTETGVEFLIQGYKEGEKEKPAILALSSWQPYPLPAAATIPIGMRCSRAWLLLQNYVHPMRCYVPNGEVVLNYADGTRSIVSLVPPYNLDCYFQQFALDGMDVPLGKVAEPMVGWMAAGERPTRARAQLLQIAVNPDKKLESIEIRATCSEGVIGLTGLTLLPAAAPASGIGLDSRKGQP